GSLDYDLVTLTSDAAEGPVGVDQMIGAVTGIHHLIRANQVEDRPNAHDTHHQRKPPCRHELELQRRGDLRRGDRQEPGKMFIAEGAEGEDDGKQTEPGEIPAYH